MSVAADVDDSSDDSSRVSRLHQLADRADNLRHRLRSVTIQCAAPSNQASWAFKDGMSAGYACCAFVAMIVSERLWRKIISLHPPLAADESDGDKDYEVDALEMLAASSMAAICEHYALGGTHEYTERLCSTALTWMHDIDGKGDWGDIKNRTLGWVEMSGSSLTCCYYIHKAMLDLHLRHG